MSHHLRTYTASVAFPLFTRPFILNFQVMYSITISTIIITRVASYVRSFSLPTVSEGSRFVRLFGRSDRFHKDYSRLCLSPYCANSQRLLRRFSGPPWSIPVQKHLYKLTYSKNNYNIAQILKMSNNIFDLTPLISVYPFIGFGAYVPSPLTG